MAEPIQLTPEQQAEYNSKASQEAPAAPAGPVTLTPEQQAEYAQKASAPINPIKDLDAANIADLATKDPTFNIADHWAQTEPTAKYTAADEQKAADAMDLLRQRGVTAQDITEGAKNLPANLWNLFKGLGKFGSAVGEALQAKSPVFRPKELTEEQAKLKAAQRMGEATEAMETGVQGLMQQVRRASSKIESVGGALLTPTPVDEFGKEILPAPGAPLVPPRTDPEKLQHFFDEVAAAKVKQGTLAGKGPALEAIEKGAQTLGRATVPGAPETPIPTVTQEAAQKGMPIRPEEVAAMQDPLSFEAYGKLFNAAGAIGSAAMPEAVKSVISRAGAATATGLQKGVGAALKVVPKAADVTATVSKALPATGAIVGAVKGAAEGSPYVGYLAGEKIGQSLAKGIQTGAKFVQPLKRIGEEVAGTKPVTGNVSQLIRDTLQAAPGAAGEVAKGAAFDLGMAATAETPDEARNIGIGTAFGLLGAGRGTLGRVVSGQVIAPRARVSFPVSGTGNFPALEALHQAEYKNLSPGEQNSVNEIRSAARGLPNGGAEVFVGTDPEATKQALIQSGVSEESANNVVSAGGFATNEFADKNGVNRRVVILRDPATGPHEITHPIDNIMGEDANRLFDRFVLSDMANRGGVDAWGQFYARKLGMPEGGNWRDYVVKRSNWGRDALKEKLGNQAVEALRQTTGVDPTQPEVASIVDDEIANRIQRERAIDPNATAQEISDRMLTGPDGLTPEEQSTVAERYIAREAKAEAAGALFSAGGKDYKGPQGVLPRLARVVAGVQSALGGEPLAGRLSNIGFPLSYQMVQETGKQIRGGIAAVTPKAGKAEAKPVLPIVGGPRQPATIPVTPEQQQDAAKAAQDIAAAAPDVPVAGGTKSQREILGTVAQAIAGRQGVKINYLSAPDEPAAATTSNRTVRRAIIEAFRNLPQSARALWEKTVFPERILQTKSGYQVMGWSPEVFAANAHKLAQTLVDLQAKGITINSPYELDTNNRTFTATGWQDLYDDTQRFVKNQISGRTGAGEPLIVPPQVTERGFFAPPTTGKPAGLDQRRADFVNLLFNFKLPETPRITSGKLPLTIAGQEISAATLPGRVEPPVRPRPGFEGAKAQALGIEGREILEVNPVRNELEDAAKRAGIAVPSFIEAIQKLNLENIKEAEVAPEQPEFRGNTLTLSAGFSPETRQKDFRHSWIDDKGEIYPAYGDHANEARRITGNPNPQDAMFDLFNRGWKRVRQEGGTLWAQGQGNEPLTRDQRNRLETIAINNELTLKHDRAGSPAATLYTPPGKEDFIGGQFSPPTSKDVDGPEQVAQAAIKTDDGKVYTGFIHSDAMEQARKAIGYYPMQADSGFLTTRGRFVSREEAYNIANREKQIPESYALDNPHIGGTGPRLEAKTFNASQREDLIGGQFSPPTSETVDGPEQVAQAAVRFKNGFISTGVIHALALENAKVHGLENNDVADLGFLSTRGRWLSRADAAALAQRQGQIAGRPSFVDTIGGRINRGLASEDLLNPQNAMDRLMHMPDDEFAGLRQYRGEFGGGPTGWAFDVGALAKEPEDLNAMKRAREVLTDLARDARDKKDLSSAMMLATRAQLAREAYEAATGHQIDRPDLEGSALKGMRETKPDYMPPMSPQSEKIPTSAGVRPALSEESVQYSPQIKNSESEELGKKYAESVGMPAPTPTKNLAPPVGLLQRLADAFEVAPHDPGNPEVKKAYRAFLDEMKAQAKMILDSGVDVEPFTGKGEPYANSEAMLNDVKNNKHLYFLKTDKAFGGSSEAATISDIAKNNLVMEPSGLKLHGYDVLMNDVIRFAHDYFGHTPEGNSFGPRGEFNAFLTHAQMFSPEAQKVLLSELLAQTGWFFEGKHIRRPDGSIPVRGDPDYIRPQERPFIDPKNTILPKSLADEVFGIVKKIQGGQFSPPAQEPRVGKEFTKFFNDVSAGRFGKSNVPFQPEQDLSDIANVDAERQKYASNFEQHIDRSIPMHYEEKTRKIDGVVKSYPEGARVLDIAGSEGDFGKTISSLSDGKIKTVSVDPNEEMARQFALKPQVPGATYAKEAWLHGFEDSGVNYPAHKPEQPYDLINEAVAFQFIDPNRDAQIAEVKKQLKPNGVFISLEKVKNPQWQENENFKDKEFKSKYWKDEDLAAKEQRVGFKQSKQESNAVGMLDNMVTDKELETVLKKNFKHVTQYFDSGNFKGYAASDDADKLSTIVSNIGDLNSKFSTVQTPRALTGQFMPFVPDRYYTDRGLPVPERKPETPPLRGGVQTEVDIKSPKTYIVRHGTTALNNADADKDKIRGHKDVPLNAEGRAEAEQTANDLANSGIQHIVTSDLSRASDTAKAIAEKTGATVEEDPGLRPWKFGPTIEGKPTAKMLPVINDLVANPNKRPEGGETFNEFKTRFLEAFKRAQTKNADKNTAIVTHYRGTKLLEAWRKTGVDNDTIDKAVFERYDKDKKPGFFETVNKAGEAISLPGQFSPEGETEPDYEKYNRPVKAEPKTKWTLPPGNPYTGFSKGWISPDNEPHLFGGIEHHTYLNQTPALREKYDLPEIEVDTRNEALKKGFTRLNYETKNGRLTVEARAQDWPRVKKAVQNLVRDNASKLDSMSVHLTDPNGVQTVASDTKKLFDVPNEAKEANMPDPRPTLSETRGTGTKPSGIGWSGQFSPAEQQGLFGDEREPLTTKQIGSMTKPEMAAHFPEVVIPKKWDEKISSDVLNSPLAKKAGSREEAVKAFAKKLVAFAKENKNDPVFDAGSKWYSEFVPALKKEFGEYAQMFAELLAATSPRTGVTENFSYANDALEMFKKGKYDKQIVKFEQGLEKLNDGSWERYIQKEIDAGKVEDPPKGEPSPATFLAHWIVKNDLQPRQSNGQLFGTHSTRILQVLARVWLEMNKGPKVKTFVSNLLGTGHDATIDVWADRTMRRMGYEGLKDRWRILPGNQGAVDDKDFDFAQEAFRAAARQLKMKPDALQGALWFAEKKHWAKNGWAPLDLGSFQTEMQKLPLLRGGVEQRLATTEAKKTAAATEQPEFTITPRNLK